ncbi:MAG: hypothetical protein WCS92_02195 [Candidatus Babeliales bacterium]|jgi:hypothetical protein
MQNNVSEKDFYEIYDYYSQPLLEKKAVQISLFSAATIIIVGIVFLYIFYRRYRRPLTHWEVALLALENLKLEKCVSKNDFKIFYFKLTEIFKKYLEKRYGWKVENKTDEELVILLEKQNFNREFLEPVQKILAGALWIKFANQEALKIQAESDLKTIINIIDQTKQVEKN